MNRPVPQPRTQLNRQGPWPLGKRHNAVMRVERARENVFKVTATSEELSALVAGARMALEAMRAAPDRPPGEALEVLERVLSDFDRARERLTGPRPAADPTGPRRAGRSPQRQAGAPADVCSRTWAVI